MKHLSRLSILLIAVAILITTGCTTGIQDGMRVAAQNSSVRPSGYVTSPPQPGAKVRVQARHPATGAWITLRDNINIKSNSTWTTKDGTKLYAWDAGNMAVPNAYWLAGTGGSYARLRAQWYTGTTWYNTLVARGDWLQCFLENYNDQGNTLSYMLANCFSHRGEAYVYTAGYREGPASCGAPAAGLAKTNGHYMINQVPSCARTIISNRIREKIDEQNILLHYEISHSTTNAASKDTLPNDAANTCNRQPGADGSCELGGFFGGHERYIRRMERHVMVYDYPWMPKGKIPAWNGSTWIPTQFQNAEVSPNGSCESWTCAGWRSDPIADSTPNAFKPVSASPANVCSFASTDAVAVAVNGWHSSGHVSTGGHFGTFDSPANPLFFLWHNAINDVWVDYRNCP